MSRLEHWQKKIQEKRKQTPWRKFVKEICSWHPIVLTKVDGNISRYPDNERVGKLLDSDSFQLHRNSLSGSPLGNTHNFFHQFSVLYKQIPKPYLMHDFDNENAAYADIIYGSKNIYLSIGAGLDAENVFYSFGVNTSCSNVISSVKVVQSCENIFSSIFVTRSSNIFYSENIQNSSNIWFSSNLIGCHECILSDGLVNKTYCIKNTQYEKDIYFEKKKEFLDKKENYIEWYTEIMQHPMANFSSTGGSGEGQFLCQDVNHGYMVTHINEGRNVIFFDGTDHSERIYDTFSGGVNCSDRYGVTNAGYHMEHVYCCADVGTSSNVYYSTNLQGCSYCLGCVGLKNQSFCIFNKQYEKEERFEKVDEIFAQMEDEETLGEFFPGRMNPFYFNDTAAYLIDDSFTKEEVEAEGYLWRDEEIKVDVPEWMEVLKVEELDQYEGYGESGNWRIDPSILKKVIQDEEGNVYRVIKMEYDFLMKHGLPLPRNHWLERLKDHFRIEKTLSPIETDE